MSPSRPGKRGKAAGKPKGKKPDLEALKRHAAELSALQAVALTAAASLDPKEVLDKALDVLMDITDADAGAAFVWDAIGQAFRASRYRNLPNEVLFEMRSFQVGEGISGNAAEQLEPIIIHDLTLDPRNVFPGCVEAGHRSIAVIPFVAAGRSLGLVRLISEVTGRFSEKSLEFFRTVGSSVGLALANANVFKETDERLRRKTRQLEELSRISRQSTSSLEPEEVYASVVKAAVGLAGAEKGALLLVEPAGTRMRGVAGHGMSREEVERLVCDHAKEAAEQVMRQGRALNCCKLRVEGGTFKDLCEELGIRTVNCFPLFEGTKPIGALVVANTLQPLLEDDVAVLSGFADQSVQAIRNTLLYEQERRRAREMSAAKEIALAGSALVEPASTFKTICQAIQRWLGYEMVWLGVIDAGSREMRPMAHAGSDGASPSAIHLQTDESILGECVRERRPVWVKDCAKKPRYWPWTSKGVRAPGAAIAVPIELKREIRGVLFAARKKPGPFTESDVGSVELAASETATAMRNSELYSETLNLYSRISHIHNLSREVSASLDLKKVLRVACKNAVEALDLKMAWIGLISEESYRVEPVAHFGAEEGYLDAINITYDESPTGRGPTGTAIRTRKPVAADDLVASPTFSPWRASAVRRGYRSSCAVPLIASGKVLGALNVYGNKRRAFTSGVKELLQGFADQAAIAIQNAQLHDEMRESESLKDKIFHSLPYALFVVDQSGEVLMANEATRSLSTGRKVENGVHYSRLLPGGHPARKTIWLWVTNSRVPEPIRCWHELPGQARQFLLSQSAEVFIGGKPHLLVSVHDLTTQKSLDESLEHTDRLSLAGNMAAQLAHEISNPLALMSSQIQRMMESGEVQPPQLDRLLNNVDRVASLVENLSHLGRRTALHRGHTDVGKLVRETVRLTEYDNRFREVEVVVDIAPDVPSAKLDGDKISQVLINLLLNAADAMPKGGNISVSCRLVRPVISWNGNSIEGEYVLVSVRDTGQGIAADVMKRMWEPFYTTKPIGKGTGLGLPVSMSIMDQHRGYLEARSVPGKGSTFTMWIPVKTWPRCWEATPECTMEIHQTCPVFRHQSCHRCWSDLEGLCHARDWSNPFVVKPDALIRET